MVNLAILWMPIEPKLLLLTCVISTDLHPVANPAIFSRLLPGLSAKGEFVSDTRHYRKALSWSVSPEIRMYICMYPHSLVHTNNQVHTCELY